MRDFSSQIARVKAALEKADPKVREQFIAGFRRSLARCERCGGMMVHDRLDGYRCSTPRCDEAS